MPPFLLVYCSAYAALAASHFTKNPHVLMCTRCHFLFAMFLAVICICW